MRREGGAVFPLAASGGRPRHRARLRPVRVGRRSHERAVASAWRLRPVRVGAAGKCRIRPPGRPVARGGGAGADGISIPLVSLSPGPAGLCAPPEPGPGTRGGPRDGRRKQGRCLRRRSGRGLGVVVSQRGRPGREPLLIANGPSGPFPAGSGVRGPGWVRWGRSSAGFGWGSGSWRGPGRRAAAGRVGFFPARAEVPRRRRGRLARACGLPGPVAGAPLHLTGAGPPSRSSSRPVRWCCTSERVAPHEPTSSFPRGSGVFSRMPVFSGSAPMRRAGPSAHGRISTALNAGAFPHDSTDPPPTGPVRMCSTGPALPAPTPRTRTRRAPALPHHRTTPGPAGPSGRPGAETCASHSKVQWCFRLRSAHLGEEDEGGGRLPRRDPSGEKGSMRYAPDGSRTPEPILGPSLPIRGWRC